MLQVKAEEEKCAGGGCRLLGKPSQKINESLTSITGACRRRQIVWGMSVLMAYSTGSSHLQRAGLMAGPTDD